ncbi:MAG: hypothetical protein HF975_04555 [ANME-2 cluster archaeon]|nr:hypothetical protein [ANME-2 cluster archaeon]
MEKEYPHFSDFAEESKPFKGEKKKIEDILGKEILIIDFRIKESKQRIGTKYITLQFMLNNETYITFTGSNILIEQMNKYSENIPFHTTIEKIHKYYTFT